MADPNFSESQLQAAVNGALVRYVWENYGVWLLPYIVSLWDEFDRGWDSGFALPWITGGDPDLEGCNVFIQYKLSEQLVSPGAGQWAHWNEPYYRFKIPHKTRTKKKSADDYHQWRALHRIAKSGYATFYVTNHTLSRVELRQQYDSGALLDRVAWLDVGDVKKKHRHVTFTENSPHFFLHSEKEQVERTKFHQFLAKLRQEQRKESLQAANTRLISEISSWDEQRGSDELSGANAYALRASGVTPEFVEKSSSSADNASAFHTHMRLRSFLHKHYGIALIWVPRIAG